MMVRPKQNSRTVFMPRTRAPDGCGREREPKSECDSLGVRLADRRALNAQYVVDELTDQPMVTNCNLLAKPSNGAVALADVREPTLAILCEPCGGRGCYNLKRLIAERGTDAKLPDLFVTLADCDKARSLSIHDRCRARYERYYGWWANARRLFVGTRTGLPCRVWS